MDHMDHDLNIKIIEEINRQLDGEGFAPNMFYSFDYSNEMYHIKELGVTTITKYTVDKEKQILPSYIYIVIKGNKDTGPMILNVIKSHEGTFSFIDTTKTGGARKSRRNRKGRKARRTRKH